MIRAKVTPEKVADGDNIPFHLVSLPLYMVGQVQVFSDLDLEEIEAARERSSEGGPTEQRGGRPEAMSMREVDLVATCGYTWHMDTVGIRELKNHLSEYVRRVRAGETIRISSHGEVVAELRVPEPDREKQAPPGLRELVRRGAARGIVRNDPSRYRTYEPALTRTTARKLLDWDRDDR